MKLLKNTFIILSIFCLIASSGFAYEAENINIENLNDTDVNRDMDVVHPWSPYINLTVKEFQIYCYRLQDKYPNHNLFEKNMFDICLSEGFIGI